MRHALRRSRTVALAVLFLFNTPSFAAQVIAHNGLWTGKEFLDMPELQRRAYAAGMMDALLASVILVGANPKVDALGPCVVGMTDEQLVAIIEKRLREEPELWHRPVNAPAVYAIKKACSIK